MLVPEFPKNPAGSAVKQAVSSQYKPLVRRSVFCSSARPFHNLFARKLVSGAAVLLGALTVKGLPEENVAMTSAAHPPTTRFQNGDTPFANRLPLPKGNSHTVATVSLCGTLKPAKPLSQARQDPIWFSGELAPPPIVLARAFDQVYLARKLKPPENSRWNFALS